VFRRRRFRGFQQRQVFDENKGSNRDRCIDAADERSLGRFLFHVLRHIRRISLVQHDVSMMRKALLTGVAVVSLLGASAAHATEQTAPTCELEVKILKDNSLHVLEKCDGAKVFHGDMDFYHPKGGPHDAAHKCKLEDVEQIDKAGAIVHTYCEYRKGNKKAALVLQIKSTGRMC
jgi:hypothetical protein